MSVYYKGEITSPIMFSLFLNDIELHLHSNLNACITLDQLTIYFLLFSDDAAVLSESAPGLQESLSTVLNRIYLSILTQHKLLYFIKGTVSRKTINGTIVKTRLSYLGIVFF